MTASIPTVGFIGVGNQGAALFNKDVGLLAQLCADARPQHALMQSAAHFFLDAVNTDTSAG